MTATDELRRLLDGRRVEWDNCVGPFPQTAFNVNGVVWQVKELVAGLDVSTRYLTPAQAVEATLGSDLEAENAKLRELVLDYEELAAKLCDARECDGCPFDSERTICEHMRLVARVGELGVEV